MPVIVPPALVALGGATRIAGWQPGAGIVGLGFALSLGIPAYMICVILGWWRARRHALTASGLEFYLILGPIPVAVLTATFYGIMACANSHDPDAARSITVAVGLIALLLGYAYFAAIGTAYAIGTLVGIIEMS